MKRLAISVILFFTTTAFSIVDMKNANFANSWTDLEIPGTGYDLKVTRTYNSKSLFDGMFGFGWCSDFETNLKITAEGNIKLTECGAGQEQFYTPREFGRKEIDKTISQIITKVREAKKGDEKTLKKMAEDMVSDHDLRSKFAVAYKVAVPVKEGTRFFANGQEVESITYSKGIYTRYLPDGSYMRFDKEGNLAQLFDKNSNYLKFDYDGSMIKEIVDNNGRKLTFKYFTNKKVKSISAPNSLSAEYKFENQNDLKNVVKSNGETHSYEYDDTHNMTKAVYPDGKFVALTYDKKNDWVTSFTDREKCSENYKYEFDSKNPKMHYWSTVKKTCGKEVVNESKHEFWFSERKDGQVFLARVNSKVNKDETDITYHEVFGKPIAIRRNNVRYTYTYYSNGQVKEKNSDNVNLIYVYDSKTSKVIKVTTISKNEKGKVIANKKTDFRYDAKGNLNYAQNSEGLKITMTYDGKGRIASIVDQAKKLVKIDYEERFGKPAVVARPGLGTIRITYKSNGEIDGVKSDESPSVAMQIAGAFNNLLDVISPATAEVFSN